MSMNGPDELSSKKRKPAKKQPTFSNEERLGVIRSLGYYRMRLQGQRHGGSQPLLNWELDDLVETLETIEGSLLRVWPILEAFAQQPYIEGV